MAIRVWRGVGVLLSAFAFLLGSAGCGGTDQAWVPSAEQLSRAETLARFSMYMSGSQDEKPAALLQALEEADGMAKALDLVPADFSVGEKRIGAHKVRIEPGAASKVDKYLMVWFCDPEQIPDWQTRKDLGAVVTPGMTRQINVGKGGKLSLRML